MSKLWEVLSVDEKELYRQRYNRDKEEYKIAMQTYQPSEEFLAMKDDKEGKLKKKKPMEKVKLIKQNEKAKVAEYFQFVADNWREAARVSAANQPYGGPVEVRLSSIQDKYRLLPVHAITTNMITRT